MIYTSPDFPANSLRLLNKLRKKNQSCDLNLVMNGVGYPAHKAILIAGSPYVQQLVSKDPSSSSVIIGINIHNTQVVEDILNFLYVGEINLSDRNLAEVMLLATYFEISEIQTLTAKFMQHTRSGVMTPRKIATVEVNMDHSYNLVENNNVDINEIIEDIEIGDETQEQLVEESFDNSPVKSSEQFEEGRLVKTEVEDSNNSRQCRYCLKHFSSRNSCMRHTLMHTGEKPYMCELCGKAFSRKDNMLKHCGKRMCRKSIKIQSQAKKRRFRERRSELSDEKKGIIKRDLSLSQTVDVSEYLDPKAPAGVYLCRTCGKTSSNKANFRRHINMHIGLKPYQCLNCLRHFSRKDNLEGHLSRWKDGSCISAAILANSEAEASLAGDETLSKSLEVTHQVKEDFLFRCEDCEQMFDSFTDLYDHCKEKHDVVKEAKCPVCQLVFSEEKLLTKHLWYHKTQQKPNTDMPTSKRMGYRCIPCGKLFLHVSAYQSHDKINCTTTCRFCDKVFSSKSHLCRHIRTHFKQNLLVCALCQKACRTRAKLASHVRQEHCIDMPKHARIGRSPLVVEVDEMEALTAEEEIVVKLEQSVHDNSGCVL